MSFQDVGSHSPPHILFLQNVSDSISLHILFHSSSKRENKLCILYNVPSDVGNYGSSHILFFFGGGGVFSFLSKQRFPRKILSHSFSTASLPYLLSSSFPTLFSFSSFRVCHRHNIACHNNTIKNDNIVRSLPPAVSNSVNILLIIKFPEQPLPASLTNNSWLKLMSHLRFNELTTS